SRPARDEAGAPPRRDRARGRGRDRRPPARRHPARRRRPALDREEARSRGGRAAVRSRAARDPRRRASRLMRLAINLALSAAMLALCLWLVWPDAATRTQLGDAFAAMRFADFAPYLAAYIG